VGWNGLDVPEDALRGTAGVVHLSGEPIFGRPPTAARRDRMHASRVLSTESLAAALGRLAPAERPAALACASAVGYYADGGEALLTEEAAAGAGFLARLCRDWEEAARRAEGHGVRAVSLRIGLVLGREGGALRPLRALFALGLGGPLGRGEQWVPWIQADDLARLIEFALDEPALSGPVNAVAPEPVRNRELTRALAERVRRPAFLRVPAFALRAALGELAGELLDSRRVVPARALAAGFRFEHRELASALSVELG
jgi:hypothetical protein